MAVLDTSGDTIPVEALKHRAQILVDDFALALLAQPQEQGERLQEMAFADGFTVGWVVGKRADLATSMTQRVLEAATQAWVDGEMSRGIPESEEEETK